MVEFCIAHCNIVDVLLAVQKIVLVSFIKHSLNLNSMEPLFLGYYIHNSPHIINQFDMLGEVFELVFTWANFTSELLLKSSSKLLSCEVCTVTCCVFSVTFLKIGKTVDQHF